MNRKLTEEQDFYYNQDGLFVMTESYLLKRGYCCGNGCKHCPYNYSNVKDVEKREFLKKVREEN